MRTIAIANQKGGVAKTTTALNLAYSLAELGQHVLLIDVDPQSSLTLATVGDCAGRSIADVIGDTQPGSMLLADVIQHLEGLDLAPSDISLGVSELGIATRYGRESILRKVLSTIVDNYDVCILDTGPSLGLLVVNALAAADGVIAPTLPAALDLRGLGLFLDSIAEIRKELNPGLELVGVLVCMYDNRLKLHRAAVEDMRSGGVPLFPVMISKSVRAAAAAGEGAPVAGGALFEQYQELGRIINRWLKKQN